MSRHQSTDPHDDRGITLVELVIAGSLMSVIFLLAGQMLLTALSTQGTVAVSTKAATQGQLITDVIDRSVRTATAIRVTSDRLDVETADGRCQAYAVVGNSFRSAEAATALGSADSTWSDLAQRVSPVGVQPYFAPHDSGVDYRFRLGGTDDDPENGAVEITSTTVPRTPGGSDSPCF